MEGSQEGGGATAMEGKVVDFHTHLVPRSWPTFARRYGYGGFVHLDHDQEQVSVPGNARLLRDSEVIAEITPNSWDMALRVQDMDRAGVDLQVVSIVPELFAYWAKADDAADSARILNNGIAEQVKEFPDRFVALGTLPMQAPELAVAEMERCVVELGFVGVVIGTHVNQWQLDAPELITFWEMAEQLGCCVFVHPNVGEARIEEGAHALPQLVGVSAEMCHAATCMLTSGLLDSFPTLKVCFAHGAGTFPYVRGQLEHGMATGSHCNLKHMVETLEPGQYRGRLFCDSIVHSPEATKFLVDAMSSDAVVFGSDYPYPLGQGSKAAGAGAHGYNVSPSVHLPTLDESTVKQVMGANALQLLFGGNAEGAKKN